MFKDWSSDDWINHILFFGTLFMLIGSFIFL